MPENVAEVTPHDPPPGWVALPFGGPWFRQLGPVWMRTEADGRTTLGLRVAPQHLNSQQITHGGMLATLADGALGISIALARRQRGAQVTVSMSVDFLAAAQVGDWLEAHTTVTRLGRRIAYASCDLRVGERHVLRSSGVFNFPDRALPPGADDPTLPGDG